MKPKFLLSLLLVCLSASLVTAQTNTWNGSTDTDWHKPCNWSLNAVPTCNHDAVIPTVTNYPIINNVAHCRTLTINSAAVDATQLIGTGTLDLFLGGTCSGTPYTNACATFTTAPISSVTESTVMQDAQTDIAVGKNIPKAVSGTFCGYMNASWPRDNMGFGAGSPSCQVPSPGHQQCYSEVNCAALTDWKIDHISGDVPNVTGGYTLGTWTSSLIIVGYKVDASEVSPPPFLGRGGTIRVTLRFGTATISQDIALNSFVDSGL